MTFFLLIFFILYGSLHLYAFVKIKGAFHLTPAVQLPLIALMIFMVLAPLLVRVSERYGHTLTATVLSYIGYIWMGLLILFFFTGIVLDLYRLLIYAGARVAHRDWAFLMPSPFYLFIIPLGVSLALNAYGFFEARNIRTEHLTIETAKISREAGRIRIVQISDVHLGLIVRGGLFENIMETVRQAHPDILVSTGDLLDGQIDNMMAAADLIRTVQPKYGKFAVTGNHEFYAGIDQAMAFHQRAGFLMLRGEALTLAGLLNIAGVDDPAGRQFGLAREIPEQKLLDKLPKDHFTLLLKHKPVPSPESAGLYDLQLSGHTHRGQIFPFTFLTRLAFPYNSGYFDLPGVNRLYVSRGTGTWGPPIRFLSPPEITVIDLVHKE